jgi:2'-5' RNA ligase
VLRSVGAFPQPARPRVVWAGVAEGAAELKDLQGRVDRELAREGFASDRRPFVPHVTLFRVRSAADAERARRLVRDLAELELGRGTVREVELKESVLTPQRAIHRSLARVALVAAPSAP